MVSLLIIKNDVFHFSKDSVYELRSGSHLQRTNTQTAHLGSESIMDGRSQKIGPYWI